MWKTYFQSNLDLFSVGISVQKLIQGIIIWVALPPFVNRMDFMPIFWSIILSQRGFKAKHIFGNYVEFHFVIGFYYIWNVKCGRFHRVFQLLLFMHNNKGGHNQNWLIPVFWLSKVDNLKWFCLQSFLLHKRGSCDVVWYIVTMETMLHVKTLFMHLFGLKLLIDVHPHSKGKSKK